MFKKILIFLAALSISSAALADGRHHGRHYGGHYGGHHSNQWVGPLIGGIIIGGVLSQRSQPVYVDPPRYYAPPPRYYAEPPRYYYPECREVVATDYDRWGNPYQYYVRRCD